MYDELIDLPEPAVADVTMGKERCACSQQRRATVVRALSRRPSPVSSP